MEKSMSNGTKVKKRNGNLEGLNLDKIHIMVEHACDQLTGVSASQVEMQSGIQFYDGITTQEIQEILVRSASDLISLDHPNYQYVAARLLLFGLYKQVFGANWKVEFPDVYDHLRDGAALKIYDSELLSKYSMEEWDKINGFIDHHRDFLFTYAGLRQVIDKYLVQDRSVSQVFETPQYAYMLVAATIFADYPTETRLTYVRKYYDAISRHKINVPTPILAGVRTPLRQFASCVLVDSADTSIASLAVTWLLVNMLLKGRELVSTQVASGASTLKYEVVKSSTLVLYRFSKSLKQLSVAVRKMAYEAEAQQYTSQSGTKK